MRTVLACFCVCAAAPALELPQPLPAWAAETAKPAWRLAPLGAVLAEVQRECEVPVVASGAILALQSNTVTLLAAQRLPLPELLRALETAADLVLVAEPLRILVYTRSEYDAARRRPVDLAAGAAGLGWRMRESAEPDQRGYEDTNGGFRNFSDRTNGGGPISERLAALADDPQRPVMLTPEEAVEARADLATYRALVLRPVVWRIVAGHLPTVAGAVPAGTVPLAEARALAARLGEPVQLVLTGMAGQQVAGASSSEGLYLDKVDVVSNEYDPDTHSGHYGLGARLRTYPGAGAVRLVGRISWSIPSASSLVEIRTGHAVMPTGEASVTISDGKASLSMPKSESGLGTTLTMELGRWWFWQPQLDLWCPSGQGVVLHSTGPTAERRAVVVMIPEVLP